ncbi:replication-relaxation family protein [Geodermatophilus sp. SYSU D00758]
MEPARPTITETDTAILRALSRYHYLTAAQASRLLFPRLVDENRYMQRRLKRLADTNFALRLRALPTPRYGQAPHVFTLHRLGRAYLKRLGIAVLPYFRPSEEQKAAWNDFFMPHRLAAIDVLIAADLLCQRSRVSCPRLLTDRHLRRHPVRVGVQQAQRARSVAVIPDGWFQLQPAGRPVISIALELDRGMEAQKAWREKVAGYAAWAPGPYRQAFATDNLTIAVVAPSGERVKQLRIWTRAELARQRAESLSDIFLFTCASPVATPPEKFFLSPVWCTPEDDEPVALLDPPAAAVEEVLFESA